MEAIVEAVGAWWFVWAIPVIVLGVGRLVRIIVFDRFPPSLWLRQKWTDWVVKHDHKPWLDLFFCWWCLTPWVMLVAIGWFALTWTALWVAWAWWLFWGWLALSYVTSMVMERDEPERPES